MDTLSEGKLCSLGGRTLGPLIVLHQTKVRTICGACLPESLDGPRAHAAYVECGVTRWLAATPERVYRIGDRPIFDGTVNEESIQPYFDILRREYVKIQLNMSLPKQRPYPFSSDSTALNPWR